MTQQPIYPPQYPQAPAQPMQQQYPPAPQVQQPYPPQQQYPPQGYPQPPMQQYPQAYAAPQQPPAPPLANGTLDDFYNQPSAGSGPSLSWSNKPLGTAYAGHVARDVTSGDVQQQTDPSSGAPKFFRDGRPMFVMKVPLKVQQSQEFPEGEATWYVRGQARDELSRAMAEAGTDGAPRRGALIQVTLVQRRPSRMGNPANVVQVVYTPDYGTGAPSPAPVPQQPVQQQAPQPEQPPTWAQPAPVQQPQLALPVQQQQQYPAQPVQQQAPVQVMQQPVAPQGAPTPPPNLDPEQQALLARLTQGQAPQAPAQQ